MVGIYDHGNNSFSFFCKSSPLSLIAIIFPCGSIRKLDGMPRTLYNAAGTELHPFKSDTCSQTNPSLAIALIHASFELSNDTPNTVKFLSL